MLYVLLVEFQKHVGYKLFLFFCLNELLRSKVKNGKKGEEALRSCPFNVDKKCTPWRVV